MSKLDWKSIWENTLKNKELFPVKIVNSQTVSVSCPTRFSNTGKFSINITPKFNEDSIVLELLVFNENISVEDLDRLDSNKRDDKNKSSADDKFNKLSDDLVSYELSNRIMERFKIKSDGFESDKEAEDTLVDYINNKATESGRMFDDKLDSIIDTLMKDENFIKDKSSGKKYESTLESIRSNRRVILSKVESILKDNYKWHTNKNESYDDSVMPLYGKNNKLSAVVSIVDDCIIVDIAEGITAKVSMMKSDNEIESELVDDIDNAMALMPDKDKELEDIKDAVSGNLDGDFKDKYNVDVEDDDFDYIDDLSKRVSRLESLYIKQRLRKLY
jgi:hypothetical protein